jgi:hypothetical protein
LKGSHERDKITTPELRCALFSRRAGGPIISIFVNFADS